MPINIEKLAEIYSTSVESSENNGWIAIPDSKSDTLIVNALGSSGGNPGNGWKIHISIDPTKMSQAAQLIAQELNSEEAPRVSIKFAGKQLASTGQPSKQVAFIFYEEELINREKIANFLSRIEFLLRSNNIGPDPRPINSDTEAAKTKYDAIILDDQRKPTRFNYRNEQCIVMEDELYNDVGGIGNTSVQGEQIWVKQSYYLQLPNSQKHNPGNRVEDPFAEIQIKSPNLEGHEYQGNTIQGPGSPTSIGLFKEKSSKDNAIISHNISSFTNEHVAEVEKLIKKLEKEIQSCWPYPNKDRKAEKVRGLRALLKKAENLDASTAVEEVEREFPEIRKGSISTRTADLLDNLRNDKNRLEV